MLPAHALHELNRRGYTPFPGDPLYLDNEPQQSSSFYQPPWPREKTRKIKLKPFRRYSYPTFHSLFLN